MTKCGEDKFVVLDDGEHTYIEIRDKEEKFLFSVCCEKCLVDLKKAILRFEVIRRKRRVSK